MILPLWVRLVAIAGVLALLIAGVKFWESRVYKQGYAEADAQWRLKESRIETEAQAKAGQMLVAAQVKERELNKFLADAQGKRISENKDNETKFNAAVTRVTTRIERLSIDADNPFSNGTTAANPAIAGGPAAAQRVNVVPEFAEAILGIARDSARDMREYNAVVEAYNAARLTCNASVSGAAQ